MTEKATTTISEEPLSQMEPVSEPVSDVGELSQWQLIVLRFRKNKLAMGGVVLLVIMYLLVAFAGFLSPNEFTTQNLDYIYGPPSPITFIGPDGRLGLRPYYLCSDNCTGSEEFQMGVHDR